MTRCVEHDKKLDILCSDCNVVICYRCLMTNHNQHRTLHTDDIKQSLLNIDYSVVVYDDSSNHDLDEDQLENNNSITDNDETNNNSISKDNNSNKNNDKDNSLISNRSNNNSNNNIIQDRIEWLWNKANDSANHIRKLNEMENGISDHFRQYYEMLMKEESKLKQPIIDELDQTKQLLDKLIKEIQSLYNIIQSITPTLKPEEHNNDNNNNNNNEYDILSDATINYSIPTLIESIKQSTTLEQFIHNNKIIRNHFKQHNTDINQILNMNSKSISVSKSCHNQSYLDGIRYFIPRSLFIYFDRKDNKNNSLHNNTYFITQDESLSLYTWDFKSGNQMKLMEKESKELVEQSKGSVQSTSFIGSSNTTIYVFLRDELIAYSTISNSFSKENFYGFFNFINQPVTCYKEPFYIYFYGKERTNIDGVTRGGNNIIVRYNTMTQTFERLFVDKYSEERTPLALFFRFNVLFSMYYDALSKDIVFVEHKSDTNEVVAAYLIIKNIIPTFFTYCSVNLGTSYLYYGRKSSDYFLKLDNFGTKPKITDKLATIEGRAKVKSPNNQVLVLTPMVHNDKMLYLYTKDKAYVYSIKGNQWQHSHLQIPNIQHILKVKEI
ncbi:hypothetical protein PPL_08346 [Heterostelium album PN500]|uniref:B box-type domain-containing protein n=1 Tax=Heterostelium pallidum (strain ATCC 26659 / Pp 5 / PN500) TaxID=670386 RepID=D3BHX8_HETP5|nr:hypothetical protein PPL_08346 [Heterostelium album PN500]EFA78878.1 hypothetical protein PPL_08346 [Heterostelium album PN500]|eukprot:XP_020431002.1 hypothetical protein PPL_08346 [Heterostelium album PN500]